MFDLIIIGGGPAGYRGAEVAASHGLKTLLCEERALGGVCLNEGCIPSKALLYSAKLYDQAKSGGEKYGVSCGNPVLDYAAAVRRKDRVVAMLTGGVESALKKSGVEIVRDHGIIKSRSADGYRVEAGGDIWLGANLLICTGAGPVRPPIRGIETAMTNREILTLTEAPKTLAIIGGGVIGLEMASLFNSAGSKVTVWEMLDKIAGDFDREIAEALQKIYEKKGVAFNLSASVADVADLGAEKVLVSTGRKPSTEGIGLENIGVFTRRGAIVTDEEMRTNQPGVYAAGDVNGKSMLAHTAYREAEVAVNAMLGVKDWMDYSAIPSVIYTNPEAAGIGETLASALAKGLQAHETKLPMSYSGRYVAENEGETGMCKLVWLDDRLIGAHMLGNSSSEIVSALSTILYHGMNAEQIKRIVFPHPTVSEIIKEAVFHSSAPGAGPKSQKQRGAGAGSDITILAAGMALAAVTEAAALLKERHDLGAEVIGVGSREPSGFEKAVASVKNTGRVVLAAGDAGESAYINKLAGYITDLCFDYMDAPPVVVATDEPDPGSKPEGDGCLQASWILDAIHERILPLTGHVSGRNYTRMEIIRRETLG
ncbi:MAG: FAD-dependent oxidoreductase [Clostridiales bacterium]|nr:FAD-dependent oxidoreductase [Clostridiales bacterium]